MGPGRELVRGEQLELSTPKHTGFKIVVYRAAPGGPEVFLRRVGQTWSLPAGACRMAETAQQASGRCLREEWGWDLATFEVDCGDGGETVFAAEADGSDPGLLEPGGEWFGLGKARALALGRDGLVIERLLASLE
jgi:hypothetical protein